MFICKRLIKLSAWLVEMPQYNFNDNKLTVYVGSAPIFFAERLIRQLASSGVNAKELALPKKKLDALIWTWKMRKSKPKIVHYLWGSHHPLVYIIPKLLRRKVIIHWIGTDVIYATSSKEDSFNALLRKISYKMVDMHLVVIQRLADELSSLGIDAKVVPLVPNMPLPQEDITWPAQDQALVSLPEARLEFYSSSLVFQLAEKLPEIKFLIVAHSGEGAPQLPNIKYLGRVDDMETVWKQVKVYLRLTKHDGLPQTLIEALARGKHVIWSYEYPFCHQAYTFKKAKDALRDILRRNQPNIEGMHYVHTHFESSKVVQSYKNIYLKVLNLTR